MASQKHRSTRDPAAGPKLAARSAGAEIDEATIRFAGDASDAVQQIGALFASTCATHGNAVCTLPDAAAEIRAPVGTLAGVVGFQVRFSGQPIHTPGDRLHTLVALNPAALRANFDDLQPGATLILDTDAFSPHEWHKAGFTDDPLEDGTLRKHHLVALPISQLSRDAVAKINLSPREAERCKGFFVLGLVFWLYDRPLDATLRWIRDTYGKNHGLIEAASRTLTAGHHQGEKSGLMPTPFHVEKAPLPEGRYRQITGVDAMVLGVLSIAEGSSVPLVFAGLPKAPASELLHRFCEWKHANVTVVQAEDDAAAINMALGASFGGALGMTATGGQGLSQQAETIGLAVMSELPGVVVHIQQAGPSTGMPSRPEQADLLQAMYGRHGECPLIVLAPATPADCFSIVQEAARLAIRYMTPVIVLTDMYQMQCAETWRVPDSKEIPEIDKRHPPAKSGQAFLPYERDAIGARPWATPGTPGLEYRTGGQEKEDRTGDVSFDPLNHEHMVQARAQKVASAASDISPLNVEGPSKGNLLVLGWGSTYGAIAAAAERCRGKGLKVANAHLRHLMPIPKNTGELLQRYRKVLVPEMNSGQLAQILRATFSIEVVSLTKLQGRPFLASEIEAKIESLL